MFESRPDEGALRSIFENGVEFFFLFEKDLSGLWSDFWRRLKVVNSPIYFKKNVTFLVSNLDGKFLRD